MTWQNFLTPILLKGSKIILIIISTWATQKIIIAFLKQLRKKFKKTGSETLAQKRQRVKTITYLVINITKVITSLVAFLLVLTELGINILPIITGVGILGLAIGMGARTLVADLIAGFFILLENQFNAGDWIKIGSSEGKVVKIGLRTVTLKDKEENFYIIPNSEIKVVQKFKDQP